MVVRLNSIPPVVSVEKDWGAHVNVGSSWVSHTVVGISAGQAQVAEWTSSEYTDQVIVDVVSSAQVAALTDGLALFQQASDALPLSGTGVLELLRVAGVTLSAAPIQSQYTTWGFPGNETQDISDYSSTRGGVDYFGDARKVALRQNGLIWLRFSGAAAPEYGQYVQPSSGQDGYAEVCPSGSAATNLTYGKVYGYASGSNLGGVSTAAQFVLVDFSRGSW